MAERPVASRARVRGGDGPPPGVDGHPGWVEQSVRQYAGLSVMLMATQAMIAGVGPVLLGAYSAAWWCVLLGAAGGLLLWIPAHGMMRGETAVSLDEAFDEAFGKIAGSALTLIVALYSMTDAALALRVLGSIVRQYILITTNEMIMTAAALLVLALVLTRHGQKALSRLLWLVRKGLLLAVVFASAAMLPSVEIDNLFPLLGSNLRSTLLTLPVAASGYIGVLLLSLLPKQTGSAVPAKFRVGVYALLMAAIIAGALMMIVNLSLPPQAVPRSIVWGRHIMFAGEYMRSRFFRLVYLLSFTLMMLFASGTSIAASGLLLQSAVRSEKSRWTIPAVCAPLLLLIPVYAGLSPETLIAMQTFRFPLLLLLLWATWPVLLVKRRAAKKREGIA